MKLVDIAHSLLKMAPYDQECIKSKGLQKYMTQVFPLTDWSLEAMRPSLTTIIRRLDKLFAKMHKSVKLYQAVEWKAAAGLLNAVYITLWKHPYIVNVPNLKSLIGTCQCLVVGEESLTTLTDHHAPTGRRPELPPQSFCSIVFKLIALQVCFFFWRFKLFLHSIWFFGRYGTPRSTEIQKKMPCLGIHIFWLSIPQGSQKCPNENIWCISWREKITKPLFPCEFTTSAQIFDNIKKKCFIKFNPTLHNRIFISVDIEQNKTKFISSKNASKSSNQKSIVFILFFFAPLARGKK